MRSLREKSGLRNKVARFLSEHATFYRLHLAYFVLIDIFATLVIWLSPKPKPGISFIDALYNVTSCLCVTGLVSVKMKDFSQFDQSVLLLLMFIGGQAFTSLFPVLVRRYYFQQCLRKNVDVKLGDGNFKEEVSALDEVEEVDRSVITFKEPVADNLQEETAQHNRSGASDAESMKMNALMKGVSKALENRLGERKFSNASTIAEEEDDEVILDSWSSKAVEYHALVCLSWIVPAYYIGMQVAGSVIMDLYFFGAPHALQSVTERGVDRTFFSFFTTVSAFSNTGIAVVDESLVPFQRSVLLLLLIAVLILLGNTLFAPCMRFIIWLLYRFSKGNKKFVYKYLLAHPRKCYTHLFPHSHTIWLLLTVMTFNLVEVLSFCLLQWNSNVLAGFGAGYKIIVGISQSISSRTGGFAVVYLNQLSQAWLFLYAGMMYISAYPVYLSRQNTKAKLEVYDESDLCVYATNWQTELVESKIPWQAKRLLARDSAYLFISVFLICVVQNQDLKHDPLNFSVFNVIFEVISAYGTVGVSIGYSCDLARKVQPDIVCQDVPYSFSGKWSTAGKLIVVVVMFLGRHRGLPDNIDSAIQLPRRKSFSRKRTRSLSKFRDPVLWSAFRGRRPTGNNFRANPHTMPFEHPDEPQHNQDTKAEPLQAPDEDVAPHSLQMQRAP